MNQPYNDYIIVELYRIARNKGLADYSKMTKDELLKLLKSNEAMDSKIKPLPIELQIEILIQMSPEELEQTCQHDNTVRKLCQNENLWRILVMRKNSLITKNLSISWRETYINLYKSGNCL